MIPILTHGDVDLKYGYFYSLEPDYYDPNFDDDDSWIISNGPNIDTPTWGTVLEEKWKPRRSFTCRFNTDHGMGEELVQLGVGIYSGDGHGPIIPVGDDRIVITGEFLKILKQSNLKGWKVLPVEIVEFDQGKNPAAMKAFPKLYHLSFDWEAPFMSEIIVPKSADKCPFCGHGPIVCPDCGHKKNPCRECKKMWGVPADRHEGKGDPRIKFVRGEEGLRPIIDLKIWSGSDLIDGPSVMGGMGGFGGYVTRRVVDFLLSVHAYPFKAEPIPVNVRGASKADLKRLEQAKEPLPIMKK